MNKLTEFFKKCIPNLYCKLDLTPAFDVVSQPSQNAEPCVGDREDPFRFKGWVFHSRNLSWLELTVQDRFFDRFFPRILRPDVIAAEGRIQNALFSGFERTYSEANRELFRSSALKLYACAPNVRKLIWEHAVPEDKETRIDEVRSEVSGPSAPGFGRIHVVFGKDKVETTDSLIHAFDTVRTLGLFRLGTIFLPPESDASRFRERFPHLRFDVCATNSTWRQLQIQENDRVLYSSQDILIEHPAVDRLFKFSKENPDVHFAVPTLRSEYSALLSSARDLELRSLPPLRGASELGDVWISSYSNIVEWSGDSAVSSGLSFVSPELQESIHGVQVLNATWKPASEKSS